MFSEINLKLHSVWAFNKNMQCLYKNPAISPDDDDLVVVIIDSSGSMRKKQAEMKLIVSSIKCMSGTVGMWNLPEAKGPTALVDAVNEMVGKNISSIKRAIIISDGDDNWSMKQKLTTGMLVDDSPEFRDLPDLPMHYAEFFDTVEPESQNHGIYEVYKKNALDDRRGAIVTHFDNIGVEMFVVGVGKEVKDFINKCAATGVNINTALVEPNATAEDVGGVMTTVMKRSRAGSGSNKQTVTAANADALPDEELSKMRFESQRTTSHAERNTNMKLLNDGPAFDPGRQKEYVRFIVNYEASKKNLSVESVEAILIWFRSIIVSQGGAPVAGALIGGRLYPKDKRDRRNGPVFDVPNEEIKPSAWTNTFSRILEILSREPAWILTRVEGLSEAFSEDFSANRVGPVFAEVGMPATFLAISKKDLPQVDATLYYKFKENTYPHYVLNHRARGICDYLPLLLKSLPVVYRGNSGAKSYGGPVIEEVTEEVADAAVVEEMESEDGESSSEAGETYTDAAMGEVNLLKRKVEVLEEDNEQLKKKIAALKNVLDSD